MIEGLYQIDWSQLTHANGEALDVPGLLLGLASPEPMDREISFEMLQSNIWNQGAVYEATVFSVPFIIQLVQNPLVEEKARLLTFLARLANGNSPLDVLSDSGMLDLDEADPEFRLRLAMERNWARATRRAVRKGIPAYLYCLEQPAPEVRAAAAYLLACFGPDSHRLSPYLIRRLGCEGHPLVQASLVLALGVMPFDGGTEFELLEKVHRGDLPALVRMSAALAIVRCSGEYSPPEYMVSLIDFISCLDPDLPSQYARLPWADGHLYSDLSLALCHFGERAAPAIIPDLIRVHDRAGAQTAVDVAYAMLFLAFGGRERHPGETAPIDVVQHNVLEALAESKPFWRASVEACAVLKIFGLPDSPAGIKALLASE